MSSLEDLLLPDDNYGFVIENDRDLISLKYLVSEIGEEKLFKSLLKYKKKWPDASPFVSTILKWYNLKVPPKLYRPVKVTASHFVYIFSLKSKESCKVGHSIDPEQRMGRMHVHGFEPFDLMNSYIAPFATAKEARDVEKQLKKLLKCDEKFSPYNNNLPEASGFYWGSTAHTEWFNSELLNDAMQN